MEIGTGSGYQTAILCKLTREVYSIERIKPLLDEAFERLLSLEIRNVHFRFGDGTTGWPETAPFDRIIIAAGVGAFQSRRLALDGVEPYEGGHIHYRVKDQELFRERDLVILGGGDSALDWALALTDTARSIVVVHRRSEYRAAPASVQRLFALRDAGRLARCTACA